MANMAEEPVKVKMTLRTARPSIQGAVTTPASAAAVEAVEARWREEDKKVRSANLRKRITGCLSWIVILVAVIGAVWYFLGEKYLPAEYTLPKVWERLERFWTQRGDEQPREDPADAAVAGQRVRLREFVDLLDHVCKSAPPVRPDGNLESRIRKSAGNKILESVISADAVYLQAQTKFAEMNAHNEKIIRKSADKTFSHNSRNIGRHIGQYSVNDLLRQQNRIEELQKACNEARKKAVKRAADAIKSATAKWTGPESKKDAARFQDRLLKLFRRLESQT